MQGIGRFFRNAPPSARAAPLPPLAPNPARAERSYRGGQYLPEGPSLTPGHLDLPEARAAAERARWATKRWGEPPGGRRWGSTYLDSGNFGMAYRVDGEDGPALVKLPAARDLHDYAWSRRDQTRNIMHEAGVANELREAGVASVPRSVYAEFDGGTPAVVREWGEPASSITPAEYASLELDLVRVERELGWRVADDLDLYRRADGGVFVGDVGFWRAPDPAPTRPWKARDTDLDGLLRGVQTKYMAGTLAEAAPAARRALRGAADGPPTLATLARLHDLAESARREYEDLADGGASTHHEAFMSRSLLASLEHRALAGLPDPPPEIAHAALLAAAVDQRAPRAPTR